MNSFYGVADFFCTNYRCFFVDLNGFGQTPIEFPMTLEDYCNEIKELILHYDIKEVVCVGHSFGGRICLMLATMLPQLKAIVLVDAAGLKPKRTIKYYYRKFKYKVKKILRLNTNKCGSPDYIKLSPIMKKTFVNVVNLYLDNLLEKILIPTLIVWGDKDKETPKYMACRLSKKIQNSGLVFLKGGHYCYLENYPLFCKILNSFVGDVYNVDKN